MTVRMAGRHAHPPSRAQARSRGRSGAARRATAQL